MEVGGSISFVLASGFKDYPMDDVYRIMDNVIGPGDLHLEVRQDGDGAIATFAGVVRNASLGRETEYLVYDAYRPMALKKMAEIGDEMRGRWEIDRVGILHRVGRLEIGEISVLIAVSAPHRRAALEACHYAIDRLKETVPIWKKEVWTDGESWRGGETANAKHET